ncbi:fluoride efflux transporter FluC [Prochlorococcus marinus]|uniref:fluoride efflux transporter FluC n=1 Tax=Prochlorococcus marinus TaxID=1219 RepID=UPI0022B2F1A2|nr:CrcB family protein [Prochlorococcus marinus]
MAIDIRKNKFILISLGAIPGALLRWQIDEMFIVNLIGCFVLGFINSLDISKRYKLILGVGLSGSITTFSGWSFYSYKLLSQGLYKLFLFTSISMILIGVFAIYLGHMFGKKLNL